MCHADGESAYLLNGGFPSYPVQITPEHHGGRFQRLRRKRGTSTHGSRSTCDQAGFKTQQRPEDTSVACCELVCDNPQRASTKRLLLMVREPTKGGCNEDARVDFSKEAATIKRAST